MLLGPETIRRAMQTAARIGAVLGALAIAGCARPAPPPEVPLRSEARLPPHTEAPIAVDPRGAEPRSPRDAAGVQALPCSLQQRLRSIHGETPTELELVNGAEEPVQIFWLDYTGQRVHYNLLAPGASYRQQTFVTHPWLVVGRAHCYGLYVPVAPGSHRVLIAE